MNKYQITGMSCAACQARVEKAVNNVEGVSSCAVSLLNNTMSVEGDAKEVDIIKAVEKAGYGASCIDTGVSTAIKESNHNNGLHKTISSLKKRILASFTLLVLLMYFSMGHMMWGWPIPAFFEDNCIAQGILQLLLASMVMIINQNFFINGFKGLIHRNPNMDTLVACGSAASWIYSVWMLFLMTDAAVKGADTMSYMDEFYFESAAMILALITVGKLLEAISKGKTGDALDGLLGLVPKTAVIVVDGIEKEVDITTVKPGDIFVVKPGESIPLDGIILEGNSAVDESALTGESIPVDKEAGDEVTAASINQSGFLRCKASRVGEDTMLAQIIKMVTDASATKAPIAKTADRVAAVFVPVVMCIAVVTFIVWIISGEELGYALARAISVLVISCPCALGLATPVAIMVGSGVGAKHGILYKNAASLEELGRAQIVALDKTGTITTGKPVVTDCISVDITENELLTIAASIESKSEHPLAGAIVEYARQKNVIVQETTEFEAVVGNGLRANLADKEIIAGSVKYISNKIDITQYGAKLKELAKQGKTPVLFAEKDRNEDNQGYIIIGIIAMADEVKSDAVEAIGQLKKQGMSVVMLTGDNSLTADAIANKAGVDYTISELLPQDKEKAIRTLKKQGHVVMVGDGINDALALTTADAGIAIGAGTDIAIDAADIVLLKDGLNYVPAAIRLGRASLKNIKENLFWAFIYNIIGIPLAAGAYVKLFGWSLNPMFGAAAMSLSSFCVITNALRLNLLKLMDGSKDRKIRNNIVQLDIDSERIIHNKSTYESEGLIRNSEKENNTMTKTMNIEGMMCGHCEARVKKTLEAIEGVTEAIVSHEQNNAIVKMNQEIDSETLKTAVEEQGYSVTGII